MSGDPTVMHFIAGKPNSREDSWTKLLRNIGHWSTFNHGIFVVRNNEGSFVGEVGLTHFSTGLGEAFDPFPEASWILATNGHKHGYATEAANAVHDCMMQTHNPLRTVCIVRPDNLASVRVASKLGYVKFGEVDYRGASPIMFERLFEAETPPASS